MGVRRRADTGRWIYRTVVKLPSGKKQRIFGTPERNTKAAAEQEELLHIARVKAGNKPDAPTFGEWFNGRFWDEWVAGRKNKPSEAENKRSIYRVHLAPRFADTPIDEIDDGAVARFRAHLIGEKKDGKPVRGEKTTNNILAVLSKALHYAKRVRLIDHVPEIGLFKIERPEIEPWEWEEYAAIVAAAKAYKRQWWIGVLLAGEAGLRVGEVKALRWSDVDLRAGTITVAQQTRHGATGTPKGRTRRTIPMTAPLASALKAERRKAGHVLTGDLTVPGDNAAEWAIETICRRAGLPVRKWHTLRHTFGTHAAQLGVNPWRLQGWMGHKQITETMLYLHHAEAHRRPVPELVLRAAGAEIDPDRRILLMLGARGTGVARASQRQRKRA